MENNESQLENREQERREYMQGPEGRKLVSDYFRDAGDETSAEHAMKTPVNVITDQEEIKKLLAG